MKNQHRFGAFLPTENVSRGAGMLKFPRFSDDRSSVCPIIKKKKKTTVTGNRHRIFQVEKILLTDRGDKKKKKQQKTPRVVL